MSVGEGRELETAVAVTVAVGDCQGEAEGVRAGEGVQVVDGTGIRAVVSSRAGKVAIITSVDSWAVG